MELETTIEELEVRIMPALSLPVGVDDPVEVFEGPK